MVGDEGQQLVINEDKRNTLRLGPKFCVMGRLNEENIRVELEQTIMKVKWEILGNKDKLKKRTSNEVAIDCMIDD